MDNRARAMSIIRKLQANGFEAFLVGGCVRDIVLGRDPKDFDITTNALPQHVAAIFPNTIPVGAKFGVTVVLVDQEQFEVATYRADGAYTDGRRPDTVEYGKTAQDDVERRDFTMNGLLLTPPMDFAVAGVTQESNKMFDGYGIVDHVGGLEDIEDRIIRAIGDPTKRFEEDALRMIRAVRFAAQLGFEIDEETLEAIESNAPLLKKISAERIAAELFKMFAAPSPLKGLIPFITTGMYRYCLPDEKYAFDKHVDMLFMIRRFGMFSTNKDPMLGMAMFFADVESHADVHLAQFLKLSNEQQQELIYMKAHVITFRIHLSGPREMSEAALKRTCRQPGMQLALEIMTQNELMGKTSFGLAAIMAFVTKMQSYTPEEIKPVPLVTGKDLIDMGIPPGPIFTSILYDIESGQLNGVLDRQSALEFVRARVYQDDRKEWVYSGLSTQEFMRTQ